MSRRPLKLPVTASSSSTTIRRSTRISTRSSRAATTPRPPWRRRSGFCSATAPAPLAAAVVSDRLRAAGPAGRRAWSSARQARAPLRAGIRRHAHAAGLGRARNHRAPVGRGPARQVVVCSAHSDYDWTDFVERLGLTDKLLVLKKPFEPIEVLQCAHALTRKWQRRARAAPAGRIARAGGHCAHGGTGGGEPAAAASRHSRCADRLAEPRAARGSARAGHCARRSRRAAVRGAGARSRPLQARQRFARPSRRRRAAERGRAAPAAAWCASVDTVARMGGDEFVLIVNPTSERQDAVELAQRAIEALAAPIRISGVDLHTSQQHRHRLLSGRWQLGGESDRARRCGDVLRQATRPQQRAMLRAGHGHGHARARQARKRPARGARAAAVRAALPAEGGRRDRLRAQRRSADPLAPSASAA